MHLFGPHGAGTIKLNVIGFFVNGLPAEQNLLPSEAGRTTAVTLPTNPISTECYGDKSNLNKICSLPEGSQALHTHFNS